MSEHTAESNAPFHDKLCGACGHRNATHGLTRRMCLACERPMHGPPITPCPLTINGGWHAGWQAAIDHLIEYGGPENLVVAEDMRARFASQGDSDA